MMGALVLLLLAIARPHATVARPHWDGTVVIAIDVSGSMAANDAVPTRLEAAKAAARTFVNKQPAAIRIGVVAFGGSGVITQRPTTDRPAILAAIDRLSPQGDTGLGRGIQAALSAISGKPLRLTDANGSVEATGPDIGFYRSAAVLLMTDGENTTAPDPGKVAEVASAAGVRVFPVGFGTTQGTVLKIDGFQVATALDDSTLREIATATGGTYISAQDAGAGISAQVPRSFTVRAEHTDVTALFCLAGAILLLAGAGLSLAWFGRVI
jgi:Ca-activated chloride channel family protein